MDADPTASVWARLSRDLTELILARLPLRSIVVSGAVCRNWLSIVSDPAFPSRVTAADPRRPWFFLHGQHSVIRCNQFFAFDPDSGDWAALPSPASADVLLSGHDGFSFAATPSPTRFSFAPLLRARLPSLTSPLHFSRFNPLVAVFGASAGAAPRFIVAGAAIPIGDREDRLAVEIYHPETDLWELCSPLPREFLSGNSSKWLSSALLQNREFFVCGIYSGAVASFDLDRRAWSPVQSLRPPGVLFAFLIAFGAGLVLAGLCSGPTRFVLWSVDSRSLEYRVIGAMPGDLLSRLFDDDDDARYTGLNCVGLDGLVYVFNDDHHKGYPACICEISAAAECNWRNVPPLCGQINRFHKVVAFCSAVPLASVLAAGV